MNGHAVGRFVELFFRRWPFYLAIGAVSVLLGLSTLQTSRGTFTAQGSIFVETNSLVATQSGVDADGARTFLSPSDFAKQEIFGMLFTEDFMTGIFEQTGIELSDDPALRQFQVDELRSAVDIKDETNNLVLVEATTGEAELSQQLAGAVIDQFIDTQIALEVAAGTGSESFFNEVVESRRQELTRVQDEIDQLLAGKSVIEDLSFAEELELLQLQEAEAEAEAAFQEAVDDVEGSRLVVLQAETNIRQRYSVFGPPQLPDSRDATGLDGYLRIISFVIVAILLMAIGPLIGAIGARTVLFADDLSKGHDIPVLAVIPKINAKRLDPDGAPALTAPPAQQAGHDLAQEVPRAPAS